ncbi:MAG: 16S rRNA (cytidine(1402)-2'-O)-methyltransferase [Syntrophomonadaceae bacterium]|nr:16S rRNA (cytidine(1402)-2'-O)-methyltransferase [Syntrophomonadaceae bacterium]
MKNTRFQRRGITINGTLYVCATPIGNLEDVSIRLLKTLRKVDIIACEDTRHTLKLLNHYKIKNQLISYHEHSSRKKEDYLLEELGNGKSIALVSDAGMPGISDPGQELVRRAADLALNVEIIPGPSALISALVISGMDSSTFLFAGFLPSKRKQRKEIIQELKDEMRTIILYEAPHRLLDTLADITDVMGAERKLAVARELTKKHEEVRRCNAAEMWEHFKSNPPRGEICILIAADEIVPKEISLESVCEEVEQLIGSGMDKKEAFKMKAREHKIAKSLIYNYFIGKKI